MGWISVLFAHKVVRHATPDEQRQGELLASLGLTADGAETPDQMISDQAFFGLLESIAAGLPEGRAVGVRVGASMRCDEYGAFGLAFKSAVTLESSYLRTERYGRVVTSIANFRLVRGQRTSLMAVIEGRGQRLGLQMTSELALAAACALSREVSAGDFDPVAVHLMQPRPLESSALDEHFRCPIYFDAERDAFEVDNDRLGVRNRLGDLGLSRFFESHLESALADLPADGGLRRRVRSEVVQSLSEGVPTLSQVAQRLGMSGRTLQRRLAAEGLAYQALVDEARQSLATRLLRRSDYSLAEVAFLTGFSEQSTFGRAFKRWTGQTPRAFRRAATD